MLVILRGRMHIRLWWLGIHRRVLLIMLLRMRRVTADFEGIGIFLVWCHIWGWNLVIYIVYLCEEFDGAIVKHSP
jgi:hypothetical protein